MSYLKTSVNTYTLDKNFKNYIAALKQQMTLPATSPESAISQIVELVLARAPSITEEIEMICFGREGRGAIIAGKIVVPKPNKKGKIPNWKTDRVSFIRTPGMFIREAILADRETAEIYSNDTFIGYKLGRLSFLNEITKFSYTNATKKQSYTYTTPYGMFAAFEYGTEALGWGHVTPKRGRWLSPGDNASQLQIKASDMVKTIPPYEMYSSITMPTVKGIIEEKIRQVQFE